MKRAGIFIGILMLLVSSALGYQVQKVNKGNVIISEIDNPAVYEFDIIATNTGTAEIYSILGVDFQPKGAFDVSSGSNKVEVKAFPSSRYRKVPGNYIVEYYIKGSDNLFKDTLEFRVVSLKESISLIPSNLQYGDSELALTIANTENTFLEDAEFTFVSEFFTVSKKISLKPFESINISLSVDRARAARLPAGRYILTAQLDYQDAKVKLQGVINYLEKQGTSITKNTEGFFVRKTTILKRNEGNVPVQDTINVRKDIVSRLFTISSLSPAKVERQGLSAEYVWTKQLMPSESWQVVTTTNYTWPFLFVILVVVIAFLVKVYSSTSIVVTKRCHHVRTKGGQFALKVIVSVKARGHVDRVQVIDRLPGMTKLYEHFGIKPSRIENESRRIFWNIERMQSGEERVFSYIIYSTVNVVGRFELPSATVIYEKNGKTHEAISNRAFLMAEAGIRVRD